MRQTDTAGQAPNAGERVVGWEGEDLEHYLASNLREAARLTDKQIADNEVGPEDVVTWGDVTYGKCEVVKEKKSR